MNKKRNPTKKQIQLWNRLVKEVFNHPTSEYSIFVYEMVKRRVLGIKKEEYRGSVASHKKNKIDCLIMPYREIPDHLLAKNKKGFGRSYGHSTPKYKISKSYKKAKSGLNKLKKCKHLQ